MGAMDTNLATQVLDTYVKTHATGLTFSSSIVETILLILGMAASTLYSVWSTSRKADAAAGRTAELKETIVALSTALAKMKEQLQEQLDKRDQRDKP